MIFINFRKKFFRVIGYIFCAFLLILCIIFVISAAAFGSRETVKIFGYNLYIVEVDGFEKAPKGSAVIVKKTSAYDLEAGNLVLYEEADDPGDCEMGYVTEINVIDGVFFLNVDNNTDIVEVPEARLVGSADYSSVIVGAVVSFIKTPFGIFCVAVMPCLALILYDIIRAAAAKMPEPEVEPQLKNRYDEVVTQKNISIKSDGKATFSRTSKEKSTSAVDDVLFNYSNKSKKPEAASSTVSKRSERPIIPLTNRDPESVAPMDISQNSVKKRVNPGAINREPATPENIGIGRYVQNSKPIEDPDPLASRTTELPKVNMETAKQDLGDAFFTQTTATSAAARSDEGKSAISGRGQAPQIGRQIPKRPANDDDEPVVKRPKTSGKRSTQILASKRFDDLMSDDDDIRDKNRIKDDVVDDILSGIRK